jgi:hypothetical protein
MVWVAPVLLSLLSLLAAAPGALAQAGAPPAGKGIAAPLAFGGRYADLSPRQQALVNDWFGRFNEAQDTHLDPRETYDAIPLSVRTTFEAVTHALGKSVLTSEAGDTLGVPLDLVEHVDHVRGRVPGARGDLQFRIYVQLRPDALATLTASREFKRCHDNTVFHKDYPLNYRQGNGVPSIQFSMTRDGRHADIDVDYRSSFFAVALFDGHLTSANSDVRAGDNVDRHNQRWLGLASWWRSLFGLHVEQSLDDQVEVGVGNLIVPGVPPAGKGAIEEAVHDYLSSWLVAHDPSRALAYVAEQAFDCLPAAEPAATVDRGLAVIRKAWHMRQANAALGRIDALGAVVRPVAIEDARLHPVSQRHGDLFLLYELPQSAVPDYLCGERSPAQAMSGVGYHERKSGRYIASFVLHAPSRQGYPVEQIWRRDAGIWRIESFRLQADPNWAAIPDVRPAIESSEDDVIRVTGDPALITVVTEALAAWFLRRDPTAIVAAMDDEALDCAFQSTAAEEHPAPADRRALVRDRAVQFAELAPPSATLEEVMASLSPGSSDVRLVRHAHEGAFSIFELPGHVAVTLDCKREWQPADSIPPPAGEETYGNHCAVAFALRRSGDALPGLKIVWTRDSGEWRITSFHLLAH